MQNKKQGITILHIVTGSLCAVLFTGCASVHGTVSKPGAGPSSLAGKISVNQVASMLTLKVEATGAGDEAEAVAGALETKTAGELASRGFNVDGANPDFLVALNVSVEEFDRSGNYYRYNGTAAGRIQEKGDNSILDSRDIFAEGERKLGQQRALENLAAALSDKTTHWVASAFDASSAISANDITIKRGWYKLEDLHDYVRRFVAKVGPLEGVLSCKLIEQDYDARTATFRVLYYDKYFPEGILNRIASINELEIKPGN